jgi:hypothetical protein
MRYRHELYLSFGILKNAKLTRRSAYARNASLEAPALPELVFIQFIVTIFIKGRYSSSPGQEGVVFFAVRKLAKKIRQKNWPMRFPSFWIGLETTH